MDLSLRTHVTVCCRHNADEVNLKHECLQKLLRVVDEPGFVFAEAAVPLYIDVVTHNILRALPEPPATFQPDEDPANLDPLWEDHLTLVYDLLFHIIDAPIPPRVIKQYITVAFCTRLIGTIQSQDPRERASVATALHKIYAKFKSLRHHLRRDFTHVFMQYIEYAPSGYPYGVSELLEVLSAIIKGFATPLLPEHIHLLTKTLLPLFKLSLMHYHQALLLCLTNFIEKDPTLAACMIDTLLKCWPKQSTAKQILFLNALEEILETTPVDSLPLETKTRVTTLLASCLESVHFQVAERTLFLWNSPQLINHSIFNPRHTRQILPILFPSLMVAFKQHWHITVRMLAHSVLEMYTKHDNSTYQMCLSDYKKAHAA
ncbi:Aste57867_24746 [Aphanomyces stellatus]|uniref:Aste57867_24746 protein n=1 Tax=Aphanomyces stellatus TaxID=120398 RepID=A0A485LRA8_9STRA|nr:hypothetical protein As57867_024668 [Aphanomyces stellatus]VFU01382.1 Aste57867_24746 [Aphanomyces stellatus]